MTLNKTGFYKAVFKTTSVKRTSDSKTHFVALSALACLSRWSGAVMLSFSCLAAVHAQAEAPKAEPAKVDAAAGEALFTNGDMTRNIPACVSCHGAGGNSVAAANPKLAGQAADYIYKQLSNFKPQPGGVKPQRMAPIMNNYAATLSENEMRNVAAYVNAQTLKPAMAKKDDTIALGEKIYRGGIANKQVPACAGCHGPNGAGIPAQFPRLGGQFADYTQAQLIAFRSGTRHNSVQMNTIAARLSDAEIAAVSNYISGLR